MEPITIHFDAERYFTVRQGDRTCVGLCWDEMLGQIVNLTRRVVGERVYPMLTDDEQAERERRHVQPDYSECDDWSSNEWHLSF